MATTPEDGNTFESIDLDLFFAPQNQYNVDDVVNRVVLPILSQHTDTKYPEEAMPGRNPTAPKCGEVDGRLFDMQFHGECIMTKSRGEQPKKAFFVSMEAEEVLSEDRREIVFESARDELRNEIRKLERAGEVDDDDDEPSVLRWQRIGLDRISNPDRYSLTARLGVYILSGVNVPPQAYDYMSIENDRGQPVWSNRPEDAYFELNYVDDDVDYDDGEMEHGDADEMDPPDEMRAPFDTAVVTDKHLDMLEFAVLIYPRVQYALLDAIHQIRMNPLPHPVIGD